MSNRVRLPDESVDGNRVGFEVISSRVIEKEGENSKHVVYNICIRHLSGKEDVNPLTIERRYTHFADMYNVLRDAFPEQMTSISFPKKALMGNFDVKLIANRSTSFETLLRHVASDSRLAYNSAVISFLQDIELTQAKAFMEEKRFDLAFPLLENNFRLLSKIYTDRSKVILLSLCRLLGCSASMPGAPGALKWANLALDRYEGVSDSDLLSLYVPLLHICIKLKTDNKLHLEARIEDLKRQGVRVTDTPSLLDAVVALENI